MAAKVKPKFWEDTIEKVVELGRSTAKKAVIDVAQTFNPIDAIRNNDSHNPADMQKKLESEQKKGNDHTPLDFDKLGKKYENNELGEEAAVRNRLFQLMRSGEREQAQKTQYSKDQKAHEEKQMAEEQTKQEQAQMRQQQAATPRGKTRQVIGGKRPKAVIEQQAEFKPSSTKN